MGIVTNKLAASSYMIGLEQLGPQQTTSLSIGGQVIATSGNSTYTLSVTAPSNKSIGLGKIKFSGLTATTPSDIGSVWYPVQGTFSLFVVGAAGSYWLEGYMTRSGTTYTFNFEIANNSTTVTATIPAFTLLIAADFYVYPF